MIRPDGLSLGTLGRGGRVSGLSLATRGRLAHRGVRLGRDLVLTTDSGYPDEMTQSAYGDEMTHTAYGDSTMRTRGGLA